VVPPGEHVAREEGLPEVDDGAVVLVVMVVAEPSHALTPMLWRVFGASGASCEDGPAECGRLGGAGWGAVRKAWSHCPVLIGARE